MRGYTRSDLEAMFRLDEICFEKPFRFSRSAMRRFAEAKNALVLLATHGEELAGFGIVHRQRSFGEVVGYLLTLDVVPTLRRHGLGKHLLTLAEQSAQAAGCRAMLLHVFTGNSGAVALYEKLGYMRLGTDENLYGSGLHAWVYRKQLA